MTTTSDTHNAGTGDRDVQPDAAGFRRVPVLACPLCAGRRVHYAFSKDTYRVVRCADCRFIFLGPQPSDDELATIYGKRYFIHSDTAEGTQRAAQMKAATAAGYLDALARYRGGHRGRLLEVGCGRGELLVEAKRLGYGVTGVEVSADAVETARARLQSVTRGGDTNAEATGDASADAGGDDVVFCGELEAAALPPGTFDVCVLADVLEHVRQPLDFLRTIRALLKPDGVVVIATPSVDSWSARLLRHNWMEFKPEHLSYFGVNTVQNALHRTGFDSVVVTPGWKVLNLDYVAGHFSKYPVPIAGALVRLAHKLAPRRLRTRNVSVVASGMVVLATVAPARPAPRLSIVVPAFNEAATLAAMMNQLLRRDFRGLDVEVILVESNSTDGTREVAESFREHPNVRLVLEDRPRGKGHAVRAGFAHATGDWILIQDADLEYDFDDYDALLEPLRAGHEAFVLGSRHGGNSWWKMRSFTRQPLLSLFLNCGHWIFTTLLNALFRQRLRDPFTMFKVFRRDCLYGLEFRCNRFDFDIELLVKLIQKGYRPLEIPVNYRSRSFHEGKKVTVFRDPLSWLRAIVTLRFTGIDPLQTVQRQRNSVATTSEALQLPRSA